VVTTSQYSVLFGIPLPYLGLAYYLTLLIGAVLFLENNKINILKFLRAISGIGFLFSLYLAYLQGFVLHAWCTYCIASALITTLFHIASHLETKRITGHLI
jgi:uncharacterized membrane protein